MKNTTLSAFMAAAAVALALPALGQVKVDNAWARATVPGQGTTGAFMHISTQQPVRFVKASAPAAEAIHLHQMTQVDGQMRMRPVEDLQLVPGQSLELQPGGYHFMVMGLNKPLKAGEALTMTLEFKKEDGTVVSVPVQAKVQPISYLPK